MKQRRRLHPERHRGHREESGGPGYDGLWLAETKHDPFLAVGGAAAATGRIELGTAITVAFARNPMTVATTANDLRLLSGGRFNLGLGSQVEAHITKRFAMPWSRPAARMSRRPEISPNPSKASDFGGVA